MYKKRHSYTQGQALIITAFFFLIGALSVATGVAVSVTGEVRQSQKLVQAKQSYTAAEALTEDIIYRLQNGHLVSDAETLTVGNTNATATVESAGSNSYDILSEGNENNAIRRVETSITVGGGESFSLGVQVGNGGFTMENNAQVQGNVHSNGNISGSNGALITGTAIAVGGLIDSVEVGTTSDSQAWANQVTNSIIGGSLYCQSGTNNEDSDGNSISCDTSKEDPSTKEFPITEEEINEWKTLAEDGGTITGDYVVPANITTALGPIKITGNMTFGNNATLEMNGPIWVEGTIATGNNSIVKLDSSYGSDSEVFISDNTVSLSNNTDFEGSGTGDGYIMLLTTSSSLSAISINNNAGTVILNAQNGRITFANNSGAKQATADEIYLNENAIVTYESGLIDVNFTSGPSGSFVISSWQEVE